MNESKVLPFWFHHCTITENVIIHRAIWRTTPSSSFEPYVLFHTPHGGLRPSFRLCVWSLSLLCDMKALLHVPHFDQIWSAGNATHIFFVLCAPNTPHPPADLIPGWLPTKQKLQCDNVSFSVYFSERWMAVGRSEAFLFPPPDGWWLIMWQCVHPTSTALYSTSEIPLVFVEPPAWNRILYGSYMGSLKASPNVIWFYLLVQELRFFQTFFRLR